ncbi:MAG: WecB/TagA/CpsF family glycosyltransferase, partial [Planctomycetales bacterium]|nr:WecB/TagA/CpsF family glycosyltransferase [Planctomycetales bacterium]
MIIVALAFGMGSLLWWGMYARRASVLTLLATYIAVSYVFAPTFWSQKIGPLTWNAERVALAAVLVAFTIRFTTGGVVRRPLVVYDWALAGLIAYLTVRCALSDPPVHQRSATGPWWRLLSSFWIPALLYALARSAPIGRSEWRKFLGVLTVLGVYLGATGFAEITHQWWAVFPRYISDPTLGTHFGRARGPALMSASLGVYLTICFWAAWMLWQEVRPATRAALAGAMAVMAAGVFFTYTRSTWIGLAAGLAIVPLLQVDRRWRPALLASMLCVGGLGGIALIGKVASMGRGDEANAEHSVYQRASFTYVSLRMFRDAPIFGHGFGRFYDKKLPYLSDRHQQVELESIRGLDHHITPFSILTETGLVGLFFYGAALVAWLLVAWRLIRAPSDEDWRPRVGLFAVGVWIAYVASALFHDLTLSPSEHWCLFVTAGISVGVVAEQHRVLAGTPAPRAIDIAGVAKTWSRAAAELVAVREEPAREVGYRAKLWGIEIDVLDMRGAVDAVLGWRSAPSSEPCRVVVTPNVDHVVMLQRDARLQAVYRDAALVLVDGAPLVWTARAMGVALPERVAGSDLAPALFDRATEVLAEGGAPLRIFLLGAAPGVADRAARRISQQWPGVEVVGVLSPPMGFERDEQENSRILAAVSDVSPDLVLVGLGAPKQELWVHAHADRLAARGALCIGATI